MIRRESINRSIEAARVGGHVAAIGSPGGQAATIDLMTLLIRRVRLQGIAVGHRRALEEMNRFIERHEIKPAIDSVYPFGDAIAAQDHMGRGAFGKIAIDVAGWPGDAGSVTREGLEIESIGTA